MTRGVKDPTEPIREMAAEFPEVDAGTACTQSSFKAHGKAFLFIGPGPKGKGYKAMFKLDQSRAQAEKLAQQHPDRFEVGSSVWVTTRFAEDNPLPKTLWSKWLRESYALCVGDGPKKKAAKKSAKKSAKKPAKKTTTKRKTAKKTAKKTTVKKKTAKKTTVEKKSVKKKPRG